MGKNNKDLLDKKQIRDSYENEIHSKMKNSEESFSENLKNMHDLKDTLINFNFMSDELNLDKSIFNEELKLDDLKSNLNQKIYKAEKEKEFFNEQNYNKKNFLDELYKIRNLFESKVKKIRLQNSLLEKSVQNKTEVFKKIKEKIVNKYDNVESLNTTAFKLKNMQVEYKSKLFAFVYFDEFNYRQSKAIR